MISTSGMYLAASTAIFIIKTAPIAKFAAIKHAVLFSLAILSSSAFCSSVSPVVPITGRTLFLSAKLAVLKTTLG